MRRSVAAGAFAATTFEIVDVADAEPAPLAALTWSRIRRPTSAATSVYVLRVAPAMVVQAVVVFGHRCHW